MWSQLGGDQNASGRKGVWASARMEMKSVLVSTVKGGETHLKGEETALKGMQAMKA